MITLPPGLTGKTYAKKSRNSRSFFEKHIRDQITHLLSPDKLPKRHSKPGFKIIPATSKDSEPTFVFSAYYRNQRVKLDGANDVIEGPEKELGKLLESVLEAVKSGAYDKQLAAILASNPVPAKPIKKTSSPTSKNKKS